jgi:hypothetical protein
MNRDDLDELAERARAGRLGDAATRLGAAERLLGSEDRAHVALAQSLALALLGQQPTARWLAARAFDRLRMLAGQPQKYGTATHLVDGQLQLWPVDPGTTDSERAKWGVPALAELLPRRGGPDGGGGKSPS